MTQYATLRELKPANYYRSKLRVFECSCGFHIGLDFTYLDQVGGIDIECPACSKIIHVDGVE